MSRDIQLDYAVLANEFFNNLSWIEIEYGAPGLDPKRPFGNSDVEADVLEIIGWEQEGNDGEGSCYASWQREYASAIFRGLIPYLQRQWSKFKEGYQS